MSVRKWRKKVILPDLTGFKEFVPTEQGDYVIGREEESDYKKKPIRKPIETDYVGFSVDYHNLKAPDSPYKIPNPPDFELTTRISSSWDEEVMDRLDRYIFFRELDIKSELSRDACSDLLVAIQAHSYLSLDTINELVLSTFGLGPLMNLIHIITKDYQECI